MTSYKGLSVAELLLAKEKLLKKIDVELKPAFQPEKLKMVQVQRSYHKRLREVKSLLVDRES